jgi:hypothetical protein
MLRRAAGFVKLLPGRFGRSDREEEMMPTAEVTGSIR